MVKESLRDLSIYRDRGIACWVLEFWMSSDGMSLNETMTLGRSRCPFGLPMSMTPVTWDGPMCALAWTRCVSWHGVPSTQLCFVNRCVPLPHSLGVTPSMAIQNLFLRLRQSIPASPPIMIVYLGEKQRSLEGI